MYGRIQHLKTCGRFWHLVKCNLIWLTQELHVPNEDEIWNPEVPFQGKKLFFIFLHALNNAAFLGSGLIVCFQNQIMPENAWKLKPLHVAFMILFIGILFTGFNIFTFLEFSGTFKRARPSSNQHYWSFNEIVSLTLYLLFKVFQ